MRKPKITVIGAGSASFGLTNLGAIMRTPELAGSTLAFCDLNEEGLGLVTKLAERINREWDAGFKIEASTKAADVLKDSDFVVLSIAINREKCWLEDHELGKKYGIMHYAENAGPGGFFHAARNISVIMPILSDIERLAPDALVLNFTNPLTRICTAAARYSKVKMVGICHQIEFGYMMIGRILADDLGLTGVNKDYLFRWQDRSSDQRALANAAIERVDMLAAGINHFTWMRSLRDRQTGEELLPLFKKRFLEQTEFEPYTRDLIRIFDEVPVSGDAHVLEYLPYTSNMERNGWGRYDIQMYPLFAMDAGREDMWKTITKMANGEADISHLKNVHSERAETMMAAVFYGQDAYEMSVNIPNTNGLISNMERDAIIEVPAVMGFHGVTGLSFGALPPVAAEFCNRQKLIVDLTVKAIYEGDKNLAVQALAIDPMVDDLGIAGSIVEEGLELNRKYLHTFR